MARFFTYSDVCSESQEHIRHWAVSYGPTDMESLWWSNARWLELFHTRISLVHTKIYGLHSRPSRHTTDISSYWKKNTWSHAISCSQMTEVILSIHLTNSHDLNTLELWAGTVTPSSRHSACQDPHEFVAGTSQKLKTLPGLVHYHEKACAAEVHFFFCKVIRCKFANWHFS